MEIEVLQAFASASALFAGLVHPAAQRQPIEQLRHQSFLAAKLGLAALALAGAPVFVALRGAPNPVQAAIFALALAPVLAATAVSRRGWLLAGHVATTLAFLGIALLVAVGAPGGAAGACCWLVAAAAEGFASGSDALRRFAGAAALLLAGLFVALPGGDGAPGGGTVLLAALAVVPALQAALRAELLRDGTAAMLATSEARSRALSSAAGAVVVDIDAQGLVERVSPGCDAILGLDDGDLAGRGLFERVQVADRPAFLKALSDAAHGGGTEVARFRLRCAAPDVSAGFRYRWTEMRACRRSRSGADTRGGLIALLREAPAADAAAGQGAERAEPTPPRDSFLGNVSHELRTPLNAIIGFSDLLCSQTLRPSDPDRQRDYARIIGQSGRHLLSSINATLDLSRIQSGTFTLLPERFAVAPLVEQCCGMVQAKAEAGRVIVEADVPADLGELLGDRPACRQILLNLLAHAVKLTPERGRVTVAARVEGALLNLTVAAAGAGPGASVRADGSASRFEEELGLAVARGLVELHGGRIAIESVPGRGGSVSVRLPLDGRAAPGASPSAVPGGVVALRFAPDRNSLEHGMKQSA